MAAKLRKVDDLWLFLCPGCDRSHPFDQRWTFNGDLEKPTFSPSLRVFDGSGGTACHSFVRDGRIEFCADSPHAMAGRTVDLPDWDEQKW